MLLKRISHKLTNRLYFTLGYELNTVASFNGRIAFCTLYIGPESYREGLSFAATFNFGRGATSLLQLLKPLVVTDEVQGEPNRLRESRADDT